eukprot:symbB.v1.2.017354.t2/scaffold1352.1/size234417/3
MGHKHTDELQEQLRQGELRPVCEEILRNYDRAYDYHLNRGRSKDQIVRLEVDTLNCSSVAINVVSVAKKREAAASEEVAMVPRSRGKKEAQVREAKCYCGAVITRATGDPAAVSICHCSICRRLSGAPFVVSAVFLPQRVQFLADSGEPKLTALNTSKEVTRLRCSKCLAPVAGRIGKRFIALPLSSFAQPGSDLGDAWKPNHHLHYDSRIMDVVDDLVKYRGPPEPAAPGAAAPQPGSALAIPGSAPQGAMVSPMAAPVPMEALLAGHAAAAGHAVTYTTTTTTTTAVTINGAAPGGFAASPAGPPIEYAPQVSAPSPASPSGAANGTGAASPHTEKALHEPRWLRIRPMDVVGVKFSGHHQNPQRMT